MINSPTMPKPASLLQQYHVHTANKSSQAFKMQNHIMILVLLYWHNHKSKRSRKMMMDKVSMFIMMKRIDGIVITADQATIWTSIIQIHNFAANAIQKTRLSRT